ncbi:GNAT family N-acetyltransferase [Rhizobium tumorigenes]|uniref:GNAT family N-acetyltransferase n=1 Tax=Rhizobium tumorigenes TaxID=2041385 RepID=A0AAF1KD56_9HYPH|nr:GNAT family N-acetyltransferase [Rhizobium tumorigenes]WFR97831.1 GNAT family N-acetyltransferase [Rhizobium tumorigenes]
MLRETSSRLFEVRRLGRQDTAVFRDIRREAIADNQDALGMSVGEELAHDEAWYLEKLDVDHVFGGIDQTRALMGVVALTKRRIEYRSGVAALSGMYVRPTARGTGLSRHLLDAAVSEACRDGRSVVLAVTITNEAAIRLYLSAGFREWKSCELQLYLDTFSPPQMLMMLDGAEFRAL